MRPKLRQYFEFRQYARSIYRITRFHSDSTQYGLKNGLKLLISHFDIYYAYDIMTQISEFLKRNKKLWAR